MALIFTASSRAGLATPVITDKTAHALVYGVLSMLLVRALAHGQWSGLTILVAVQATAIAVAYGVSDELHQAFVPNRMAEVADVAADVIGAAIGAGAAWACGIIRRSRALRMR